MEKIGQLAAKTAVLSGLLAANASAEGRKMLVFAFQAATEEGFATGTPNSLKVEIAIEIGVAFGGGAYPTFYT